MSFEKRCAKLRRKHKMLYRGYDTIVQRDGLIVARPRRQSMRLLPVRFLVLGFLGLLAFKVATLSTLGEPAYTERVARLKNGTGPEQVGAWVMQIDPATRFVAGMMSRL